ncbi:caspase domain-containing protein [Hypoxylon trugodes]|uniref:caspase domain-containing protein n=1 Tax=Hypoxylon trugodes TaxID=326681 RepID=UPI00219A8D75|nr:caspase domain-containing protein [Hypoxylon trugodes]KAI1386851.1 caspase domain-containing protein [Hypoxylon trugodes]
MATQRRWVLLLGINFYLRKDQQLKGAVNDVKIFKEWFEDARDPPIIKALIADTNGDNHQTQPPGAPETWPTYENVTSELKRITKDASPGDLVHIHYSGHGTRKKISEEYRAIDGGDAALVLFDPETTTKAKYLRGFDLASLLDEMVENDLRVSVVLDCCSSGGISRGATETRGIPWDDVTAAESPLNVAQQRREIDDEPNFRDGEADHHWLLRPDNYTLIASCGPYELAKEIRAGQQFHGALSWHFLEAMWYLSESSMDHTYGNIIRRIRARFRMLTQLSTQNPMMMGTDSIFIGQERTRREKQATCEVIGSTPEGRIILNVGLIHGVQEDDQYTVHIPNNVATKTPQFTIKVVHGASSEAEEEILQSSRSSPTRIEVGLSATLTRLHKPKAQVQLFPGANTQWKEASRESAWVQTVPHDEPLSVDVPGIAIILNDRFEYEIVSVGTHESMNMPCVPSQDGDAISKVVSLLEHLAKFMLTESLENRGNGVMAQNDFRIELPGIGLSSAIPCTMKAKDQDIVPFVFHNNTAHYLYFTILNLRPLREITKIPKDWEYKVVEPRSSLTTKIRMSVPKLIKDNGGSRATTIFKFIVTTKPIRVSGLTLPDPWASSDATRGESARTLDSLLQGQSVDEIKEERPVARGESDTLSWTCYSIYMDVNLYIN